MTHNIEDRSLTVRLINRSLHPMGMAAVMKTQYSLKFLIQAVNLENHTLIWKPDMVTRSILALF